MPLPSVARTRIMKSPTTFGAKRYFQTVHTYGDVFSTSCALCHVTPSSADTSTRLIPEGPASAQPYISNGALTVALRSKIDISPPSTRGEKNPELTLRQQVSLHPRT